MLGRKLVVPEVYELMGQVQALMIRSQATPVRQACSAVRLGCRVAGIISSDTGIHELFDSFNAHVQRESE